MFEGKISKNRITRTFTSHRESSDRRVLTGQWQVGAQGFLSGSLIMRILLTLLFVFHGVAHLPGFRVPWRLAVLPEMPYSTRVLGGSADLRPIGIRMVGLLWVLAALAFIVAGFATFFQDAAWRWLAIAATVASLALTILGWPESRLGFALNLLLLAYLLAGAKLGLIPGESAR